MMKSGSTTYFLAIILLMTSIEGLAQSWHDYQNVLSRYPLLYTSNAAALTSFTPSDSAQFLMGDTRLELSMGQGHMEQLNKSPHAWQTRAGVQSIYRMSRRVVVRGMMDYKYEWGTQAGGSVWIEPEQRPFDITETADSTRGNISLETYSLDGLVGVDVGHGVSLGARFGYTTATGAKKKDPRHTNSLMHCDVGVGATWKLGSLTLGADYLMKRTTEALKFSTVGRTDQIYHYLIDNGAFFGRKETTDGNGYVGSSNERPFLDIKHGMAILTAYQHGTWDLGAEGRWMHRHGHFGLESPSMIDFNRHNGDECTIRLWWQRDIEDRFNRVTVSWDHQALNDHERTYRVVTNHGVTDVNYYDDRLIGNNNEDVIALSGETQWGVRNNLATWQAAIDLCHTRRSLTASLFPFYRQQQTHLTQVTLQGGHNRMSSGGQVCSVLMTTGYADGGGTPYFDGEYQQAGDDAVRPQDNMLYLMREYEYLTARRIIVGMDLGWSMPLERHDMRLYIHGRYRYNQAFDVHHLQDGYRHQVAIEVGCRF